MSSASIEDKIEPGVTSNPPLKDDKKAMDHLERDSVSPSDCRALHLRQDRAKWKAKGHTKESEEDFSHGVHLHGLRGDAKASLRQ
jgi:hypothetical protein